MTEDRPPHVILIVMDSVAAKRCSAYGHRRPTTPGLERLAREGVLYRHCFTPASWTFPTHISLLAGLYPGEHGARNGDIFFQGNYYTLQEILQGLGYRTIGISSNGMLSRDFNFNCGFDEFYEMRTLFNCDRFRQMRKSIRVYRRKHIKSDLQELVYILWESVKNRYYSYPFRHMLDRVYRRHWGNILKNSNYATEKSIRIAKKVLKKHRREPVFLFMNFMEAHTEYKPPARFKERIQSSNPGGSEAGEAELLHEAGIAYLDDRLAHLYDFLQDEGLAENTMFIVTADHGEGFGEHGIWGHVFSVYNELVHIPLIVKYPKQLGLTGESDELVQLHDLFATILEIVQSPLPVPASSRSLLGPGRDFAVVENVDTEFAIPRALAQKGPNSRRPDLLQPCLAIVDKDLHKLVNWQDGRLELYDLREDYPEQVNLAASPAQQSKAAFLKSKLMELSAGFGLPR